jgi:hypothetical protein
MPTASAVCPSEALARSVGRHNLCRCAHSLSSSSATREAIDLFLREEEATRALEAMLLDEPEWLGRIYVQPVELDGFVAFFSSSDDRRSRGCAEVKTHSRLRFPVLEARAFA